MPGDNTAKKAFSEDHITGSSRSHWGSPDLHLQALEASIDGIAILDDKERFVFVNRSFASVFGYNSAHELSLRSWRTLFPITELQYFQDKLIPQLNNRGRLRVELSGIKRWGTRFPIELSLTALEGGETICIIKEITKRKEAEYQTALMSLFAELNPFPVLRFKPSGQILMANEASNHVFRVSSFKNKSLYELIPEVSETQVRRCIENNDLFSCSSELHGNHFHFIFRGIADRSFAQAYGTDISELVDAKKELLESQSFLRKVIDTDPNLIFVKDREGRFVLANQTVADLYGTTTEEIVGKRDADFNPNAGEIQNFTNDDIDVIDNLTEKLIREEVTDVNGTTHWLETVKKPFITRNNETLVLGVGHDVTDTRELQQQLVQSQKMEAIGKLAGGIAHDFNNLLTGIIGYTTLLQGSPGKPEQVLESALMIQNAAERAGALTQKLLGFARQGKHQNTLIDLNVTIKETIELLRRTVEESIAIKQSLCEDGLTVMGDPVQLQQVILNLIVNARDAIKSKAKRSNSDFISVETRVLVDYALPSNPAQSQDWGEIVVHDSGCGISKENLDRVFEPFFTTKENQGGTGMGLAMVYGIIQNHEGTIQVQSTESQGSTFRILLPFRPGEVKEVEKPRLSTPIKGQGTILVVDDHEVIREVAGSILSNLGYSVISAQDGLEAIEYYSLHKDEIQLVILDMVMPRMGAAECFRRLKDINPDVRVVLSTGYVDNNDVQEILDQGLYGFIQKPYHADELGQIVGKALDYARNSIARA